MPRIPRYDSRLQLRTARLTRQPSAVRVSPEAYGIEARAVAGMGKVIAAVGEKMDAIQAKSQLARANTEAYNAFGQIEQEANQDTNSQGFRERYNKRLTELKQQISKTITNPRAKNQFSLEYDRDVIDAQFRLSKRYNTLVIDEAHANFVLEKDALSDKYYRATTPTEKQLVIDRTAERYNDMFKMGVMTKTQAAKEFKKWKEDLVKEQIGYDISIDALSAKEKLLNKEYGPISPGDLADWLKVADTKIEFNKKLADKMHNEKWLENGGNLIANLEATTVADIIDMIGNDEINPDLGNDLIKWKTDPAAIQYETDKEIWTKLAEDSVSPELDLLKFQNAIAKAVANKQIQAVEAAELSVQVKGLIDSAIKFKAGPNRFIRALKSAIGVIKSWTFGNATDIPDAQYRMMKELFRRAMGKDTPPEETEKIVDEIIKSETKSLNPVVGNADEKGTLMIDAFGNKAMVYPDGRVEEID